MVRRPSVDPIIAAAVQAALDKKAEGVSVLDLRGLSDVTDYFVICHGRSGRQAQTISDSIEHVLHEMRRRPKHIEGYSRAEWILMDYWDFIVHIFTADRRAYYALDRLWADAPRLSVRPEAARSRLRAGGAPAGDAPSGSEDGDEAAGQDPRF
jgi:ribosome-associated protein